MTCSSSTISRPDRELRPKGLLLATGFVLGTLLLMATPGVATPGEGAGQLVVKAREDLSRGDGIAAEARLRQALNGGVTRKAVAAYMGEALRLQGDEKQAREWLETGGFAPASAAYGYRALARLERDRGNLPAAGNAFDRAIAITPNDAAMWVEIGRLRYAGGEHLLAIKAAEHALRLDPGNVRALEFEGQIVRDRFGLVAALPWFEAALARTPDDLSVLGEYAATLGELNRAREMLVVTRKMLDIDPGNPRAYYLQAVLAARAGNYRLGRVLLGKTRDRLDGVPGAILLEGVLELGADNPTLAVEAFDRLAKLRPYDKRVERLLARALFLTGEYSYLVARFGDEASDTRESSYLQTLVGRAYENMGRRDLAAPFLDMAARRRVPQIRLVENSTLLESLATASMKAAANPGFFDNLSLAGDAGLLAGDGGSAATYYARAARIRMPESLMTRRVQALLEADRPSDAQHLAETFLFYNPTSRPAMRLVAGMSAQARDWRRARTLYANLAAADAGRDVQLLVNLAYAQMAAKDPKAAEQAAQSAYRLQRANPMAAQAWALTLAQTGQRRAAAEALLSKARAISGDNPALAQARLRLAGMRER